MLDGAIIKVLIAGGGVAGVEGMLALRHMLGARVEIEMLASKPDFVYRPLAVAEPFGLGDPYRLRLDEVAEDRRARFRLGSLASIDAGARLALTDTGEEIGYDALLIAVGARPVGDMPGALVYGGLEANQEYRDLLDAIEAGEVGRVVYAVRPLVRWALPLYELALLTAHHASSRGVSSLELTLVTPEARPLEMFGPRASDSIERLLADAEIEVRTTSAPSAVEAGELALASGARLAADRVVTLPRLEVPPLPGVPQGPDGFIGTDLQMRVEGLSRVYAAGDATWFPAKQGGIAAQQADVAATAIVSLADPSRPPAAFRPVLRGALLTGAAPRYLRAEVGDRARSSASGASPLWWPPSKIAARYLAPYLAHRGEIDEPPPLDDVPPLHGEDELVSAADHQETLELSLAMAEADARWHDYEGALRWLNLAEQLNLTLPPSHVALRERCEQELRGQRT
ncbi:MAG TPA: FAD-dependent oxidoreductase [Solirubrobacterales bacterium]|nr:FAD-dependent oxidoreductase [Solirubrobacterales bacterium]